MFCSVRKRSRILERSLELFFVVAVSLALQLCEPSNTLLIFLIFSATLQTLRARFLQPGTHPGVRDDLPRLQHPGRPHFAGIPPQRHIPRQNRVLGHKGRPVQHRPPALVLLHNRHCTASLPARGVILGVLYGKGAGDARPPGALHGGRALWYNFGRNTAMKVLQSREG